MKHLFLLLFLGLHLAPLLAQTEGEETVDFDIVFKSRFFLDTLVNTEGIKFEYGSMFWEEVILSDSLENKLGRAGKWTRGSENPKISFKNIKKASTYYLKYTKNRISNIIDTITLAEAQKGKFVIDLYKEESQKMAQLSSTILEKLNVGDTLKIVVKSYPSPSGEINIIKKENKYTALLPHDNMNQKMIPAFYQDSLSTKQLQMIKAFDIDSHRTFRNSCHDINQYYVFFINQKKYKEIYNDCRAWTGYFILKKGLFDI